MSTLDSTETHRFRCEVRQLLKWGITMPRGTVSGFLERVEKMRGKVKRDQLEAAYREQWTRGNRGEYGDWRDAIL